MKNKSLFMNIAIKNDENSVINFNISGQSNIKAYAPRAEIITTMVSSGDAFCRLSAKEIKALQLLKNFSSKTFKNYYFLVILH